MKRVFTKEHRENISKACKGRIVKMGNMDDMFNFGFLIGKRQAIRESLDILNNTTNNK